MALRPLLAAALFAAGVPAARAQLQVASSYDDHAYLHSTRRWDRVCLAGYPCKTIRLTAGVGVASGAYVEASLALVGYKITQGAIARYREGYFTFPELVIDGEPTTDVLPAPLTFTLYGGAAGVPQNMGNLTRDITLRRMEGGIDPFQSVTSFALADGSMFVDQVLDDIDVVILEASMGQILPLPDAAAVVMLGRPSLTNGRTRLDLLWGLHCGSATIDQLSMGGPSTQPPPGFVPCASVSSEARTAATEYFYNLVSAVAAAVAASPQALGPMVSIGSGVLSGVHVVSSHVVHPPVAMHVTHRLVGLTPGEFDNDARANFTADVAMLLSLPAHLDVVLTHVHTKPLAPPYGANQFTTGLTTTQVEWMIVCDPDVDDACRPTDSMTPDDEAFPFYAEFLRQGTPLFELQLEGGWISASEEYPLEGATLFYPTLESNLAVVPGGSTTGAPWYSWVSGMEWQGVCTAGLPCKTIPMHILNLSPAKEYTGGVARCHATYEPAEGATGNYAVTNGIADVGADGRCVFTGLTISGPEGVVAIRFRVVEDSLRVGDVAIRNILLGTTQGMGASRQLRLTIGADAQLLGEDLTDVAAIIADGSQGQLQVEHVQVTRQGGAFMPPPSRGAARLDISCDVNARTPLTVTLRDPADPTRTFDATYDFLLKDLLTTGSFLRRNLCEVHEAYSDYVLFPSTAMPSTPMPPPDVVVNLRPRVIPVDMPSILGYLRNEVWDNVCYAGLICHTMVLVFEDPTAYEKLQRKYPMTTRITMQMNVGTFAMANAGTAVSAASPQTYEVVGSDVQYTSPTPDGSGGWFAFHQTSISAMFDDGETQRDLLAEFTPVILDASGMILSTGPSLRQRIMLRPFPSDRIPVFGVRMVHNIHPRTLNNAIALQAYNDTLRDYLNIPDGLVIKIVTRTTMPVRGAVRGAAPLALPAAGAPAVRAARDVAPLALEGCNAPGQPNNMTVVTWRIACSNRTKFPNGMCPDLAPYYARALNAALTPTSTIHPLLCDVEEAIGRWGFGQIISSVPAVIVRDADDDSDEGAWWVLLLLGTIFAAAGVFMYVYGRSRRQAFEKEKAAAFFDERAPVPGQNTRASAFPPADPEQGGAPPPPTGYQSDAPGAPPQSAVGMGAESWDAPPPVAGSGQEHPTVGDGGGGAVPREVEMMEQQQHAIDRMGLGGGAGDGYSMSAPGDADDDSTHIGRPGGQAAHANGANPADAYSPQDFYPPSYGSPVAYLYEDGHAPTDSPRYGEVMDRHNNQNPGELASTPVAPNLRAGAGGDSGGGAPPMQTLGGQAQPPPQGLNATMTSDPSASGATAQDATAGTLNANLFLEAS